VFWGATALSSPADIEIDAHDGRVVSAWLGDYDFYDLAFAWEMRRRVYVPEATNGTSAATAPFPRTLPCPSTNEVSMVVAGWASLCHDLGSRPITETNLSAIDWRNTCIYTNPWIAPTAVLTRV